MSTFLQVWEAGEGEASGITGDFVSFFTHTWPTDCLTNSSPA